MAQKTTVSVALDADIQQISQKIQSVQNQLNKLNLKQGLQADLAETITKLQQALKQSSALMGEKIDSSGMKKLQKNAETIQSLYDSLERQMSRIGFDTTTLKKDQKAINELAAAQERFKQATKDSAAEQKKLQKAVSAAQSKTNKSAQKAQTNSLIQSSAKKNADDASKKLLEAEQKVAAAREAVQKRIQTEAEKGKTYSETDKRLKEVKDYNKAVQLVEEATKNASSAQEAYNEAVKKFKIPSQLEIQEEEKKIAQEIENATQALQKFNQEKQKSDATAFQKIREELEKIQGIDWKSLGIDLSKINSIEDLNNALKNLSVDSGTRAAQAIKNLENTMDGAGSSARTFQKGIEDSGDALTDMVSHEKEIGQMRQRLVDFFSIGNSVRLFQRAIRSAFETVKELDSAMTEIAVVSDFSVGDMWERLPEFTAQANELGVAIKDAYEATTLFVQQGLDLQNSMKLSAETLKMARIAGMDAADATDAITSALRGFNMELNELSAQRINDVYSEIAAISASDVQELSTAMSKVASLAHNLGMEFETTTAFLGQMIETTREAPEVAGTALKTVTARFAEVKDLYSKGEILGSDEEGQEINVNNIQKALHSVGISMTDFLVGNEGLDQVLLRLAEKWDTIDTATKRYLQKYL